MPVDLKMFVFLQAVEQEAAAKNKPVSDNQGDLSAEETPPTDVVMIEPAQDEAMETEDSAMVVEQPPPTVVEQPPPTVLEQPPPTVLEQPPPIVVMQPPPTVVEQPPPTVVEQPPPTVLEQPPPTVVEQPSPIVVRQPPPTVVRQPPPTVVEQPPPAKDPLSQVTSDYYSAADSSKEESVREKSETAKVQEPSTPVATEEVSPCPECVYNLCQVLPALSMVYSDCEFCTCRRVKRRRKRSAGDASMTSHSRPLLLMSALRRLM